MKKLLLLSAILLSGFLKVSAIGNYNLQFTDSLVINTDTAYLGTAYKLYVYIKNNGPDSFSGDIAFKVYVAKKNDLIMSNPQLTFVLDSSGANYYNIPPHGRVTYTKDIIFLSKDVKEDSTNIVIIWPSGSVKKSVSVLKDNYIPDNYAVPFFSLFMSSSPEPAPPVSHHSNIHNTDPNISCYPNPSMSKLNVYLNKAIKGNIYIYDLNGKVVDMLEAKPDKNNYIFQLDRTNQLLPVGVYILSYETSTSIERQKFLITR